MRCEWLDEYLLSFPGGEKTYQPAWRMFLYKVRGKQFAAVCSPARCASSIRWLTPGQLPPVGKKIPQK